MNSRKERTMPKSNIKLLTKEDRQFFKEKYEFSIKDNLILVKVKDYDRITAHNINEDFSISSKVRKIKVSKEATALWIEKFKDTNFNVIDIQNAMNALILSYQATDFDEVKTQLDVIESNDRRHI